MQPDEGRSMIPPGFETLAHPIFFQLRLPPPPQRPSSPVRFCASQEILHSNDGNNSDGSSGSSSSGNESEKPSNSFPDLKEGSRMECKILRTLGKAKNIGSSTSSSSSTTSAPVLKSRPNMGSAEEGEERCPICLKEGFEEPVTLAGCNHR
jgi:hypothetical protein